MTDQNLETAIPGQANPAPAPAQASEPASGVQDVAAQDEAFFDPKTVPADLMPAYKQMQAAFTKKTQAIAQNRKKVEAYDAFAADPVGQMQSLARQYGYNMTRVEAQAAVNAQQAETGDEWQPKTWDEVLSKAESRAREKLLAELGPVVNEVRAMKQQGIEKMLDESIPEWRQYEDEMAAALRDHPTLARYPEKLARLVIPETVLEGRAMQKALRKLEAKGESARVSKGSQTSRAPEAGLPKNPGSFQDAVAAAKRILEERGIRPS